MPGFLMTDPAQTMALVVEDEWLLRLEIVDELRQLGWSTLEAASGEEALRLLDEGNRVDLLITDIRLTGGTDGWQVAEAFRRTQSQLPVIYVSANPLVETRRVEGGVFFSKPCDMALLLAACKRLCAPASS